MATEEETTVDGTQETQIPTFTPDDLIAAITLIDEAANNGSFKGWELMQRAIHTRIRLHAFAQHWQKTIEEASTDVLNKASQGGGE